MSLRKKNTTGTNTTDTNTTTVKKCPERQFIGSGVPPVFDKGNKTSRCPQDHPVLNQKDGLCYRGTRVRDVKCPNPASGTGATEGNPPPDCKCPDKDMRSIQVSVVTSVVVSVLIMTIASNFRM